MSYYQRRLPHWQPEDAALFVTWRLHGSRPRNCDAPRGANITAGKAFALEDREWDRAATGPRWLSDPRIAQCVADALLYGEKNLELYTLHAWVIMSNHVHLLIDPAAPIARITRSIKTYTSRQANAILGRTGPFWAVESYDRWIRPNAILEESCNTSKATLLPWTFAQGLKIGCGPAPGQARRPILRKPR